MPPDSTIPPALWDRLRSCDAAGEIVLLRTACAPPRDGGWSRKWVVTIRPYATMYHDVVQASDASLVVALVQAIGDAERRGWAAPAATPPPITNSQ